VGCGNSAELIPQNLEENSIHAVITDPPYGLKFLNLDWDKALPPQEVWNECFHILRPGGFLLAFGHVKLYHRLTCQLEDAGFVVKDCFCWGYATNFPKSLNIDKAMDKDEGLTRKVVGTKAGLPGYSLAEEQNPGGYQGIRYDVDKEHEITVPTGENAMVWEGWGTATKTAWEPIVMVQKPLEGRYIDNILKYHVGALNINECRIPFSSNEDKERMKSFLNFKAKNYGNEKYFSCNAGEKKQVNVHPSGRWPANLLWLDPLFAEYDHIFMIPKPSTQEKRLYNKHSTVKPVKLMERLIRLVTPNPSMVDEKVYVLDPFLGSGTTGVACKKLRRNFIGYEKDEDSFKTSCKRLAEKSKTDIGAW